MRCLLCPDLLFDHFEELTAAYLKEKQVTLLLCDLDNTLALHETARPTDAVRAWVKELTEAGIQVMIVSNNRSPARVEAYCSDLVSRMRAMQASPSGGACWRPGAVSALSRRRPPCWAIRSSPMC